MKIYIAGKITGLDNYKELFNKAEKELLAKGYKVMNPAVLPEGFTWSEYMGICFEMIDVCDEIYMLNNWEDSKGAKAENLYAIGSGKKISYQED